MTALAFLAPSRRRHAKAPARLAAKNRRHRDRDLKHQLEGAEYLIAGLRMQLEDAVQQRETEVAQIARVLGGQVRELLDEREAHGTTRALLGLAVRANRSNEQAETVQTDVTALRAAVADIVPEDARPVPRYRPYPRFPTRDIRVMPLWASPQAAGPANIPAGVR